MVVDDRSSNTAVSVSEISGERLREGILAGGISTTVILEKRVKDFTPDQSYRR